MLVKLLRALLEAFIGSKKEWISNQGAPDSRYLDWGAPQLGSTRVYTAPSDGEVVCRVVGATKCTTIQIETPSNRLLLCADCIQNAMYSGYSIPVKKGDSIHAFVRCETLGGSNIIFIPTVGSP